MQTIAQTLAGVRDHDMRVRILRWMNERFAGVAPPTPDTPAGMRRKAAASDPCLSVDGLDLFDDDSHVEMPADAAVAASSTDQPLESLARSFATDFGALAEQWQSA